MSDIDIEYHILLLKIMDEEIKYTSDYEEYDNLNTYTLRLRENNIADDELYVVAEEFVEMNLLYFVERGTVNGSKLVIYKLTEYFKENYKDIINLYTEL